MQTCRTPCLPILHLNPPRLPTANDRGIAMRNPWRWLSLLGIAIFMPASVQAAPIVAGYERFYADGKQPERGGGLLLSELNCTSCHQAGDVAKKQAPILDNVGTRV